MATTPRIDAVAVGASAGGIEALERVVAALPPDFPVPVLVVVHVAPSGISVLPQILSRAGPLRARHARHGEAAVPGVVYVAPPNHHLVVGDHGIALNRGPQENGHRPSVDVLFRSVARAFGDRVAAVVLSGTLDDGAAGLAAVKAAGGVAVVQDPGDAMYPGMPRSALDRVDADHVVPSSSIAPLLVSLADGAAPAGVVPDVPDEPEARRVGLRRDPGPPAAEAALHPGSRYSCPDCGGVLQPDTADGVLRCRVGHAWAANSLLAAQSDRLEEALWVVLRTLDEKVDLVRALGEAARGRDHTISARGFEEQAERFGHLAATVREVLEAGMAAAALEDAKGSSGAADADVEAEAEAG